MSNMVIKIQLEKFCLSSDNIIEFNSLKAY